ncbi:hypothetical protein HanRHA438_Chr12g0572761 [Helianthus annuus]|nr:hypothetical protein HanRHA438_Chr12g0572761 [Helianthus annuus]
MHKNLIFIAFFTFILVQTSTAQLNSADSRTLFQLQQKLEYPQALQSWNKWTNFCYLPSSPNLTIVGNKSNTIAQSFLQPFQDSFFTVVTACL